MFCILILLTWKQHREIDTFWLGLSPEPVIFLSHLCLQDNTVKGAGLLFVMDRYACAAVAGGCE